MNRRDIIGLGAGVCVSVTAGCLGSSGDSSDGQSDDESLWTDESDDGQRDEESTSDGESETEPVERITIGDESETDAAYSLYIRNATDDERSVEVRIDHDEETVLDRTEDVPAEAYLEIVLVDPGTYETTVESESSRSTTSITPPSADCEESRTVMTLGEGGIGVDTSIQC
ncbi:hypothetical protein [Natronorubrum tibetense]|uniref:Ig-like domain-containing protein n=1 Tax=Natronorubrum tibetense GA33 TaxID=1114856 RepID=L9W943_9EURY|nr:hypothetical protein [Natronorubrum tibetense]ELY45791.1 hypothetical protein C496_02577 [Natronorubrum tibetense GA33]